MHDFFDGSGIWQILEILSKEKKLRHDISPKCVRIKSCSTKLDIEEPGVSEVLNVKCCIILKESSILQKCSICSILSDGEKKSKIVMGVEDTSHGSKTTQNQRHTVSTNPRLN